MVKRCSRGSGRGGSGGKVAAYPRVAGINPYKLTKKQGYQLARSRGNPLEGALPFSSLMLKQKATHLLVAHTSRQTHVHARYIHTWPRHRRSPPIHVCTRSFFNAQVPAGDRRTKVFGTLETFRGTFDISNCFLIFVPDEGTRIYRNRDFPDERVLDSDLICRTGGTNCETKAIFPGVP